MDHIYDLPAWFTGGKDGEAKVRIGLFPNPSERLPIQD
jgi:hypothetical protein